MILFKQTWTNQNKISEKKEKEKEKLNLNHRKEKS